MKIPCQGKEPTSTEKADGIFNSYTIAWAEQDVGWYKNTVKSLQQTKPHTDMQQKTNSSIKL